MNAKSYLHVEGLGTRGDAYLEGTRKGLEELRRAIDMALAPGSGDAVSKCQFDDLNGREYAVHVKVIAQDAATETARVSASMLRAETRPAPTPLPCSKEDADCVRAALSRIVANDPEMIFRIQHPYNLDFRNGTVFLQANCMPLPSRETAGRVRFSFDIPSATGFRDALARQHWGGDGPSPVMHEHHSAHTPATPPSAARYLWEDGPVPESEWNSSDTEQSTGATRRSEMPAWMNGLIADAPLIDFSVSTPASLVVADNRIHISTTNFTSGGEKIGGTLRFSFAADAGKSFLHWLNLKFPPPAANGQSDTCSPNREP